ncbi:hypothetical protein M885DRAFT_335285 [Pelagophyceae sp. CCMP2097]|nr:hypothetical protein M885DRAFT_335285 [Pelagophyceae sp. CCMP2097]
MSLLSIVMLCCAACGRKHARASCPWYPEARDAHKDTLLDDLEEKRKDLGVFLRGGDVVKQAPNGLCLFHEIASSLLKLGVVTSLSAPQLREMATGWMPAHGDTVLLRSSLEDWVAKDSPGSSVAAHAASIRMGAWDGSIEIAVMAYLYDVRIHIYERSDTAGGDYSFKLVTRDACPRAQRWFRGAGLRGPPAHRLPRLRQQLLQRADSARRAHRARRAL